MNFRRQLYSGFRTELEIMVFHEILEHLDQLKLIDSYPLVVLMECRSSSGGEVGRRPPYLRVSPRCRLRYQ